MGLLKSFYKHYINTGLYFIEFHICLMTGIFWANILWDYDPYCNEKKVRSEKNKVLVLVTSFVKVQPGINHLSSHNFIHIICEVRIVILMIQPKTVIKEIK